MVDIVENLISFIVFLGNKRNILTSNLHLFALGEEKTGSLLILNSLIYNHLASVVLLSVFCDDYKTIFGIALICTILFYCLGKTLYSYHLPRSISIIDPVKHAYDDETRTIFGIIASLTCFIFITSQLTLTLKLMDNSNAAVLAFVVLIAITVAGGSQRIIRLNSAITKLTALSALIFILYCSLWPAKDLLYIPNTLPSIYKTQNHSVDWLFIILYLASSFFTPGIYTNFRMSQTAQRLKKLIGHMTQLYIASILLIACPTIYFYTKNQPSEIALIVNQILGFIGTIVIMCSIFTNISFNLVAMVGIFYSATSKNNLGTKIKKTYQALMIAAISVICYLISTNYELNPSYLLCIAHNFYIPLVLIPILLIKLGLRTSDEAMHFALKMTLICASCLIYKYETPMIITTSILFIFWLALYIKLFKQPIDWVRSRILTEGDYNKLDPDEY